MGRSKPLRRVRICASKPSRSTGESFQSPPRNAVDEGEGSLHQPLHAPHDGRFARRRNPGRQKRFHPQSRRDEPRHGRHLVLQRLHGRALVPPAQPAPQLRLDDQLGPARRIAPPEIRHEPYPQHSRGKSGTADERIRRRDQNIVIEGVDLETALQQRSVPARHSRLNADYVNQYVQYVADRRLEELGIGEHYKREEPGEVDEQRNRRP